MLVQQVFTVSFTVARIKGALLFSGDVGTFYYYLFLLMCDISSIFAMQHILPLSFILFAGGWGRDVVCPISFIL